MELNKPLLICLFIGAISCGKNFRSSDAPARESSPFFGKPEIYVYQTLYKSFSFQCNFRLSPESPRENSPDLSLPVIATLSWEHPQDLQQTRKFSFFLSENKKADISISYKSFKLQNELEKSEGCPKELIYRYLPNVRVQLKSIFTFWSATGPFGRERSSSSSGTLSRKDRSAGILDIDDQFGFLTCSLNEVFNPGYEDYFESKPNPNYENCQ